MAITNAQQARQLYNKGGPMRKIKGQDHMLAYITPGERDTLVDLVIILIIRMINLLRQKLKLKQKLKNQVLLKKLNLFSKIKKK